MRGCRRSMAVLNKGHGNVVLETRPGVPPSRGVRTTAWEKGEGKMRRRDVIGRNGRRRWTAGGLIGGQGAGKRKPCVVLGDVIAAPRGIIAGEGDPVCLALFPFDVCCWLWALLVVLAGRAATGSGRGAAGARGQARLKTQTVSVPRPATNQHRLSGLVWTHRRSTDVQQPQTSPLNGDRTQRAGNGRKRAGPHRRGLCHSRTEENSTATSAKQQRQFFFFFSCLLLLKWSRLGAGVLLWKRVVDFRAGKHLFGANIFECKTLRGRLFARVLVPIEIDRLCKGGGKKRRGLLSEQGVPARGLVRQARGHVF